MIPTELDWHQTLNPAIWHGLAFGRHCATITKEADNCFIVETWRPGYRGSCPFKTLEEAKKHPSIDISMSQPLIVVHVKGGSVTAAYTDDRPAAVLIIDHDTDGSDPLECYKFGRKPVHIGFEPVPKNLKECQRAIKAYELNAKAGSY